MRKQIAYAGTIVTVVVLVILFLGAVSIVVAPDGELDGDWIGFAPSIAPDGELDGDWIG